MLHRTAVITGSCSVLAQLGSRGAWFHRLGGYVTWMLHGNLPHALRIRIGAGQMNSPAVVFGSNGQVPRGNNITW